VASIMLLRAKSLDTHINLLGANALLVLSSSSPLVNPGKNNKILE